jgi:hypothetical protein
MGGGGYGGFGGQVVEEDEVDVEDEAWEAAAVATDVVETEATAVAGIVSCDIFSASVVKSHWPDLLWICLATAEQWWHSGVENSLELWSKSFREKCI